MSRRVKIPCPSPDSRLSLPVTAGKVLAFDFEIDDCCWSRDCDDLVFEGNDGLVSIVDFFAVSDRAMPDFQTLAGDILDGVDFRDSLRNDEFSTG